VNAHGHALSGRTKVKIGLTEARLEAGCAFGTLMPRASLNSTAQQGVSHQLDRRRIAFMDAAQPFLEIGVTQYSRN
jgi:hypothetical protein